MRLSFKMVPTNGDYQLPKGHQYLTALIGTQELREKMTPDGVITITEPTGVLVVTEVDDTPEADSGVPDVGWRQKGSVIGE